MFFLKAFYSFSSWMNLKQGFSSSCFENPLFRPHLPTASKVLCAHYPVCCVSVKTVHVPIVPLTSFGFTWPSRLPSLPAEAGRVSKRNLDFEQPQKIHIFFCKTRQNSKEGKEKEILVNELGNSQAGGKYFQQTVPRFKFRIKLSFKLHDLDIQTPAPDNPSFKMMFLPQRWNFFQVWWSRVQHYPDHLYCPKLDCSAHNMAALLYSELCNTVTHVPAPPGYVLLQQPFIFNIVEKQRCRKVNVELLSRQESPLEPWRPGNGHPGRQTCPFPRKKVKCLEFVANGWKMGQYLRQSIPIWWISFARFHDTIKWKPFYSESWTLQKTFSPLVYPPSPSACP